ncbi:hypothetical protein [Salinarimonas sp.]|uniref:hypothetical protein n=1 Tax=Salinarimonas sp. TaxID=2766526 RepID=UPI0032D96BCB
MTDDADSILQRLRDIARVLSRATADEAAADAFFGYAEDCRRWGLARDAQDAVVSARELRVAALLARGEAAGLRAGLVDPDGSLDL